MVISSLRKFIFLLKTRDTQPFAFRLNILQSIVASTFCIRPRYVVCMLNSRSNIYTRAFEKFALFKIVIFAWNLTSALSVRRAVLTAQMTILLLGFVLIVVQFYCVLSF